MANGSAPPSDECQKTKTFVLTKNKAMLTTGILQFVGGAIMVICGFFLVCVRYKVPGQNTYDNVTIGIWGGFFIGSTGVNGILSSKAGDRRSYIIYLIMSLVCVVVSIAMTAITAVAAGDNVLYYMDFPDQPGVSLTKLTIHVLLVVVACAVLIVSGLAALFTYMASSCTYGEQKSQTKSEVASSSLPGDNPAYEP